jgi:transcriptional regulator with XRE-family HTH domain
MALVDVGRCLLDKRLREHGMSRIDLAIKLDMSESQISDYVHNRRKMSLKTLINVALAIGCSPFDLYEWIPIK